MPSLWSKLVSSSSSSPNLAPPHSSTSPSHKKNPYAHPSHPSNPSTSYPAPPSLTVSRTFSPSPSPSPLASQAAPQPQNWNDIPDDMFSSTSRPRSSRRAHSTPAPASAIRPASPRAAPDYLAEAREASGRDRVTGRRVSPSPSPSSASASTSTSVYHQTNQERMADGHPSSGTKYDLFVQEMKARKGGRWRAPEGGFYAPARGEGRGYYAPGREEGG